MKFGLNMLLYTAAFGEKSLGLIGKTARMGFDGVEIPLFDTSLVDPASTRKALADHAMEVTTCSVMAPDASLISDRAADRRRGVAHLQKCIELTAEMGGRALCGPLYSPVGHLVGRGRTAAEWRRAVPALRRVGEFAQEHKVTIGIEPLNRFETYFLNTVADAVKLVKEIGVRAVGVHFDTFHAHIEEKSVAAAVKKAGRRLVHVHCCENDRGTPGTGQVDWQGVFGALNAVGYDQWLVIESFVPAIKEIAAAAAIWRRIAPSADALAADGLKFLKKMAR